jgi:hypothetical protein
MSSGNWSAARSDEPVLSTGPMINDATRGASFAGRIANPGQRCLGARGLAGAQRHTASPEAVPGAVPSIIVPS